MMMMIMELPLSYRKVTLPAQHTSPGRPVAASTFDLSLISVVWWDLVCWLVWVVCSSCGLCDVSLPSRCLILLVVLFSLPPWILFLPWCFRWSRVSWPCLLVCFGLFWGCGLKVSIWLISLSQILVVTPFLHIVFDLLFLLGIWCLKVFLTVFCGMRPFSVPLSWWLPMSRSCKAVLIWPRPCIC